MIFATVGTAPFQFNRFVSLFDELYKLHPNLDVILQIGDSSNKHSGGYRCIDFIEHGEYLSIVNQSDLIIAHCGIGVTLDADRFSKKLILVPRDPLLGEHTDAHQFDLAKLFLSRGKAHVLFPDEDANRLSELMSMDYQSVQKSEDMLLTRVDLMNELNRYLLKINK